MSSQSPRRETAGGYLLFALRDRADVLARQQSRSLIKESIAAHVRCLRSQALFGCSRLGTPSCVQPGLGFFGAIFTDDVAGIGRVVYPQHFTKSVQICRILSGLDMRGRA